MFVDADVIVTNQSWMLSAGGSGSLAWEEARCHSPGAGQRSRMQSCPYSPHSR